MAEVMQVQTFASDIRTQQHTYGIAQASKTFDQFLLLRIRHLPVHHCNLIGLELQVSHELGMQPVQAFNALRENYKSVLGVGWIPGELWRAHVREQALIFAKTGCTGISIDHL